MEIAYFALAGTAANAIRYVLNRKEKKCLESFRREIVAARHISTDTFLVHF